MISLSLIPDYGFDRGGVMAVKAGLFFGSGMMLFLGILHYFSTRKLGLPSRKIHPWQETSFLIEGDVQDVLKKCENALGHLKMKINDKNFSKGFISAIAPSNFKSWGEKISILVEKDKDSLVVVKVSSRPSMPITLIDYGKGLQNVRKINERIKLEGV